MSPVDDNRPTLRPAQAIQLRQEADPPFEKRPDQILDAQSVDDLRLCQPVTQALSLDITHERHCFEKRERLSFPGSNA
jgi:hypothetical protein